MILSSLTCVHALELNYRCSFFYSNVIVFSLKFGLVAKACIIFLDVVFLVFWCFWCFGVFLTYILFNILLTHSHFHIIKSIKCFARIRHSPSLCLLYLRYLRYLRYVLYLLYQYMSPYYAFRGCGDSVRW